MYTVLHFIQLGDVIMIQTKKKMYKFTFIYYV